ncbi:ABC transporter ATP-binding protein [Actinopolymorpha cephalotaxi]|uniref:ABC-2 type transport system ATP-binding protein n=2 Tax=Actinopolymorpha cephalotaxi TaxID=504797 RepID=A0ABX2RYY4_9ACTN|nr:ABC transporter ATP-binding protein [Actinopolymorpha cephalotaxi]NYH82494.1 ABC-2 type transport system ATP-binding protein [Actinopolymorpha cephalotaxi]
MTTPSSTARSRTNSSRTSRRRTASSGAFPATTGMAVHLSGLVKSYGHVHAVRGVDLDIAPGEVVALLGPNGAGKSTTVDMLLGLARPDQGTVSLFGVEPAQAVAQGHVGAMLQAGSLLPDATVGELVAMFAALHRAPLPVKEALERAGIADLADRPTGKLSGGQAQRVRFALAVVPDPVLLVLDEPTVGMDVESRRAFWASMRDLTAAGRTVLFATHYLDEADDYADRVVLMRSGRIIADGTAAAIKNQVSGRRISARLPGADAARLGALPGVSEVAVHGDQVTLHCTDADAALRALLPAYEQAADIEVRSVDLEDAVVALTSAAEDQAKDRAGKLAAEDRRSSS